MHLGKRTLWSISLRRTVQRASIPTYPTDCQRDGNASGDHEAGVSAPSSALGGDHIPRVGNAH